MFRKEAQKSFRSGHLCLKTTDNEPGLLYHITMKQHSTPSRSLLRCQFEKDSQSVLLSDLKRNLLKLNLNNLHYTPILAEKVTYFEFYSYDRDQIYVASSENQSKLYLVNTINKKWQKFNLNINKIIAFEINLLRNLILVADPVILNIFDERTKVDMLTYKPPKEQRILKALFTANNRSVLILTSNMNMKQLSLHDLEEEFSVNLPLAVPQPHVAISGNNKYLAITGSTHQLTLMTGFETHSPSFTVLGFPFKIKSVKFDLSNNLVMLGRDQVIYYYDVEHNRLVRLFNHANKDVIHSFDISLDNQLLCCVSNFGTIFVYSLKDMLELWKQKKEVFEERTVIVINQFEPQGEEIQQNSMEQQSQHGLQSYLKQIPSQSFHSIEANQEDIPESAINQPNISHLFTAIRYKLQQDEFFKDNSEELVQLIYAFDKLVEKDPYSLSVFFIRWIIKSQRIIHALTLGYCPQISSIVEKRFNLNAQDFVVKSLSSLFLNYFDENNWVSIVKFLLANKNTPQILVVFFLTFLKSISPSIKKCKTVGEFENVLKSLAGASLAAIFEKSVEVSKEEKFRLLFLKMEDEEIHANRSFEQ